MDGEELKMLAPSSICVMIAFDLQSLRERQCYVFSCSLWAFCISYKSAGVATINTTAARQLLSRKRAPRAGAAVSSGGTTGSRLRVSASLSAPLSSSAEIRATGDIGPVEAVVDGRNQDEHMGGLRGGTDTRNVRRSVVARKSISAEGRDVVSACPKCTPGASRVVDVARDTILCRTRRSANCMTNVVKLVVLVVEI
ncbi:hypothetical protein E4U13_001085 [Claviceps humidiphila]|uniref:Uncharacterized protein n=1 Tax=Claviceps humidiphila TaxID=1294629 RepID=A0A9P7TUG9_9HYPO|nr:hypothetical protein E4U13_001085 [Claviceps humidiphila]